MGWRFRKVFSGGPFRLNLSRRGVGRSAGIPGLRYGITADGRRYVSVGFPGWGVYWIKYLPSGGSTMGPASSMPSSTVLAPSRSQPTKPWWRQKGI